MRQIAVLSSAVLLVMGFILLAGCGGGQNIQIRYERPPQYQISSGIKRLAVAEFGGHTARDRQWGSIASDRLAAALDEYNRKFERYELVDRKRLRAIMDEQDLQLAISDAASASQAGKLANVHAMIYGSVKVTASDQRATKVVPDFVRRKVKTVTYTKRYCLTAVNFTMDNVSTGKTLAAVSLTREYDSEKDKTKSGPAAVGKMLGFTGGSLPPTDQIISHLIDECVQEFLSKISPHEVVVEEQLQGGKGKIVKTGNKLAEAGEYKDALECYEKAIRLKADDHGALFNAGLMHEALGNLAKAEELYNRAFEAKPESRYIFARKRVRMESEN